MLRESHIYLIERDQKHLEVLNELIKHHKKQHYSKI